jgi:hypothetical protein
MAATDGAIPATVPAASTLVFSAALAVGVDVQRAGAERRGRATRPGRPGLPRGGAGPAHCRLGCKANRSSSLTRSAAACNGRQPRDRVGCQPGLHHAQRRHICEGDQRLGAAEPNCLSVVTSRDEQ